MYAKIHKSEHGGVLAVCDDSVIGKTVEDKKYSLKVSEHFYKGEKKNAEEITLLLKDAKNVNLIGKKAIALGIKSGIIAKENVISIGGVPHAQSYA